MDYFSNQLSTLLLDVVLVPQNFFVSGPAIFTATAGVKRMSQSDRPLCVKSLTSIRLYVKSIWFKWHSVLLYWCGNENIIIFQRIELD